MANIRSAPKGWHSVTPRMFVRDARATVAFIKRVFDGEGKYDATHPSQIKIGDSMVMVSGTEFRGEIPACLYVYVDDIDAAYERAIKAGAKSLEKPDLMPYGDRRGMVKDPWGNIWQIATRKELLKKKPKEQLAQKKTARRTKSR